jgi:hypothetical protein
VPLAGGARTSAFISAKPGAVAGGGEATLLVVEASRLTGTADIDRWKAFRKAYLARI